MMTDDHARRQIRAAIAGILMESDGWSMVYQSRLDYPRALWPYLKIYADRDETTRITLHNPHVQEHQLSVIIACLLRIPSVGETETVEDLMDGKAALIERTLTETALFEALPLIKTLDLETTHMEVVLNTDEAISHAELTTTWRIKYMTMEGAPEALI